MPQIHDSPPSTADPDPVRIALEDPKVWNDLVRIATSYLRKACGPTVRTQLSQDADDIVNEVIQIALGKSASFDPALKKSVTAWLSGFTFGNTLLTLLCDASGIGRGKQTTVYF